MDQVIAEFIRKNINLIDNCQFEELQNEVELQLFTQMQVSSIYQTLYKAGIDILPYVTRVPRYFMYRADIKNIVIPSNISIVENCAFVNCKNLKTVMFEEGCEMIKEHAFSNCNDLRTIVLPKSVKYVDRYIASGTPDLFQIEYKGTSDDWELIKKAAQWAMGSNIKNIVCSDKTIETGR